MESVPTSSEMIRGMRGLMAYLGIAQSAVDRFRQKFGFPEGRKINTRFGFVLHWKKDEVDKWVLLNNNIVLEARVASEKAKEKFASRRDTFY